MNEQIIALRNITTNSSIKKNKQVNKNTTTNTTRINLNTVILGLRKRSHEYSASRTFIKGKPKQATKLVKDQLVLCEDVVCLQRVNVV